jgi:hypothetical protein
MIIDWFIHMVSFLVAYPFVSTDKNKLTAKRDVFLFYLFIIFVGLVCLIGRLCG